MCLKDQACAVTSVPKVTVLLLRASQKTQPEPAYQHHGWAEGLGWFGSYTVQFLPKMYSMWNLNAC